MSDDATRYLCTAAYTDEQFADRILRDLLRDDLQAVAPSVGFSALPVLRHTLAAQRSRQIRDAWLLVLAIGSLLASPLWTAIVAIVVFPIVALLARGAATAGRVRHAVLVVVIFFVALIYVTVYIAEPGSSDVEWPIGLPWLSFVIVLGMVATMVAFRFALRTTLVQRLRRNTFNPAVSPELGTQWDWTTSRLTAVGEAENGNITVYRDYRPYLGHGPVVANWSFALPTFAKGDPLDGHGELVPVDVPELVDFIRQRLTALDHEAASPRLPELIVEDRVFVDGSELDQLPSLLPSRVQPPRQNAADGEIRAFLSRPPHDVARHCLGAHVPAWGGEATASTFLHCSTEGRLLYLQVDHTALGPIHSAYHEVDRLTERLNGAQFGRLLTNAVASFPGTVLRAPGTLLNAAGLSLGRHSYQRQIRQQATEDLGYNYGPSFSLREWASDDEYHNYFQNTDVDKYHKIIERQTLAAVLDFLEEKGVDTTEFRNRQMQILNEGIIQTGGVANIGVQAVGKNATATGRGGKPAARTGGAQGAGSGGQAG